MSSAAVMCKGSGSPASLFQYMMLVWIDSLRLSEREMVDHVGVWRSSSSLVTGGFPPVHIYSSQPLGSSSGNSSCAWHAISCASSLLQTMCKPLQMLTEVPNISSWSGNCWMRWLKNTGFVWMLSTIPWIISCCNTAQLGIIVTRCSTSMLSLLRFH